MWDTAHLKMGRHAPSKAEHFCGCWREEKSQEASMGRTGWASAALERAGLHGQERGCPPVAEGDPQLTAGEETGTLVLALRAVSIC